MCQNKRCINIFATPLEQVEPYSIVLQKNHAREEKKRHKNTSLKMCWTTLTH
jgi:hypothetical protein